MFEFIKKDIPEKTRETIDFFLWLVIFVLGGLVVYFFYTFALFAIPVLIALIYVLIVMGINNKIGLQQLKEKNND